MVARRVPEKKESSGKAGADFFFMCVCFHSVSVYRHYHAHIKNLQHQREFYSPLGSLLGFCCPDLHVDVRQEKKLSNEETRS